MDPKALEALQAIAKALDADKNGKELVEAFVATIAVIADLKTAHDEDRAGIEAKLKEALEQIALRLAELKDGEPGKDGAPGGKGDPGEKGDPGKSIKGDKGEPGKDGSPDTADDIRNKLEVLPKGERLSAEYIDGLKEMIEAAIPKPTPVTTGLIGRGRVHSIDISDQLDGVTRTFRIQAVWAVIGVAASSTPGALRPSIDYTYDAQTSEITFSAAILASGTLETGQQVILTVEDH